MAKISLSDQAPSGEPINFNLSSVTFELEGTSAVYETDNNETIANALTHPWLDVEADVAAVDPQAAAPEEPKPVVPTLDAVADSPSEPVADLPEFADQPPEGDVVEPAPEAASTEQPQPAVSNESNTFGVN